METIADIITLIGFIVLFIGVFLSIRKDINDSRG